jgi:hypothetical protein
MQKRFPSKQNGAGRKVLCSFVVAMVTLCLTPLGWTQQGAGGPSRNEILNMTMNVGSAQHPSTVRFKNGSAVLKDDGSTESYDIDKQTIRNGSLGGSATQAAVFTVDENGGGSGIFSNLVAVWKQNGVLKNSHLVELGDRVPIKAIEIRDGVVVVTILTQGPNDGMCCPTKRVTRRFKLQGDALVAVR